ncbi:MAG: R3H domain-containing nucleic acid-binding protein [Candidatus Pacebacteria bacterium]|jgi:spoIIIJ-associated protein|nr:R3H domain-containing nucleic acid-binding protein [Candidatus Paceibacterota bacterium]|tara:strand:+ start:10294 stop:10794 length:501 start_codon:yes stop_codon:yes gene_type:complete
MIDDNNKTPQGINQNDELKVITKDFLEKLTVEFESIEVLENDVHPTVLIKTSDSGVLIGNNGENLRALNHLVKKIVEKKLSGENPENKIQFLLDVNGYHGKKMETLKNQAKILAERARMFKSSVEMSPMNAYERMIIHATFAKDSEIKTESEGEGKMRRVVLKYKN